MTLTCDHAKHGNKAKHPDPVGVPLVYMVSSEVFEPLKADVYDLCHFYQLGGEWGLSSIPRAL